VGVKRRLGIGTNPSHVAMLQFISAALGARAWFGRPIRGADGEKLQRNLSLVNVAGRQSVFKI